ncbi:MAG: hypothetical protein IPH88_18565 [Bacteroidales bacterium]|nr:hypothetical protein [Bacteroidales bacterium]
MNTGSRIRTIAETTGKWCINRRITCLKAEAKAYKRYENEMEQRVLEFQGIDAKTFSYLES